MSDLDHADYFHGGGEREPDCDCRDCGELFVKDFPDQARCDRCERDRWCDMKEAEAAERRAKGAA